MSRAECRGCMCVWIRTCKPFGSCCVSFIDDVIGEAVVLARELFDKILDLAKENGIEVGLKGEEEDKE